MTFDEKLRVHGIDHLISLSIDREDLPSKVPHYRVRAEFQPWNLLSGPLVVTGGGSSVQEAFNAFFAMASSLTGLP